MRFGQYLRDYLITSKPGNTGAGRCLWAFAQRAGVEYFVKEFLDPKRPQANFMGSAADYRLLHAQCTEFERRHHAVMNLINPADPDAGNLVCAVDFFHEGTRYHKVTPRIDRLYDGDPVALSPNQKKVLLGTLLASIRLLHRLGIVHGDLKPQNVLLHRPAGGTYQVAKLIDFDDAYVAGNPPPPDVISGDTLYGAPEWTRYAQGDPAVSAGDLTTAADLFALGLMMHFYLTGELPRYEGEFGSPAEAVNAGSPLALDPRLTDRARGAIGELTAADPADRPPLDAVLASIVNDDAMVLQEPRTTCQPPERQPDNTGPVFGVDGTSLRPAAGTAVPPPARPSRLRINLGR